MLKEYLLVTIQLICQSLGSFISLCLISRDSSNPFFYFNNTHAYWLQAKKKTKWKVNPM